MKNFGLVQTVGSILLLVYTIILWGLPLAPALALFDIVTDATLTDNDNLNYIIYGLAGGLGFMTYIPVSYTHLTLPTILLV